MYRKYVTKITVHSRPSTNASCHSGAKKADHDAAAVGEVERRVREMWEVIDNQPVESSTVAKLSSIKPMPGTWKTVRVFVSSTFTDFFSEREILVKKVFPELREWCRERRLQLLECDLRWGVPKDATSEETILVCLEEIDRCLETNQGQPFFLNMTGERYGWAPSSQELPPGVVDRYQWVLGTSITLMEILHGAYRSKNPNAIFFLRNPDFIKDIPEKYLSRFQDTEIVSSTNLQVMKEKLRVRFPGQVFDYTARVGEVQTSTGRELLEIGGLEDFAANVLESLKTRIEATYPTPQDSSEDSEEDQERGLHWLYAVELAEVMLGREMELQQLLAYAGGQAVSLPLQGEDSAHTEEGKDGDGETMLVVEARSGWGKSSLLAAFLVQAAKSMPDVSIFYHFCGATPKSWQARHLLQRLLSHLLSEPSEAELSTMQNGTPEEMKTLLDSALTRAQEPTLLVFDAVNELDNCEDSNHMTWLPSALPAGVRCVVSTNEHSATQDKLKQRQAYWLSLKELDTDSLKQLAVFYLGRYSKKLDKEQLEALVLGTKVDSPLWMSLMCEELRVFGDFRGISPFIGRLPDTQDDFLSLVMNRLLTEDDTGCIRKVLCLLAASNAGLPQAWLLQLLGEVGEKQAAPPLHWALARRHLASYLRSVGHPNTFLVFKHQSIQKAMKKILEEEKDGFLPWHIRLADFYQYWCDDASLRNFNLPYHLSRANLGKRLIDYIQNDKDAGRMASHMRSQYLQKYRCKFMTFSEDAPVRLCYKCASSRAAHGPWLRHDVCVVCQAYCFPVSQGQMHAAHLCTSHNIKKGHGMRCYFCSAFLPPLLPQHKPAAHPNPLEAMGRLCNFCGFGGMGNSCAALQH